MRLVWRLLVLTKCMDCGARWSRIIPKDLRVHCRECGSEDLIW